MAKRVTIDFTSNGFAVLRMVSGKNWINHEFVQAIDGALDEVERNPSCKALITTGSGKFYSNGLDIEWLMKNGEEAWNDLGGKFLKLIERLMTFPIPTVAAVNGHAFAGGAILALGHDLRVMNQERGWICLNEIHIRRVLTPHIYQMLKRKASPHVMRDMTLFGKRYTAQEGKKDGIIDEVANDSVLIQKSIDLARKQVGEQGLDRTTLQGMKKNFYSEFIQSFQSVSKTTSESRQLSHL